MTQSRTSALCVLKGLMYWALIMLTILVASTLAGCASKSAQLSRIQPEKVVIINYFEQTKSSLNCYKVKRLQQGVVDYIYSSDYYLGGDTVFATFR